MTVAMLPHILLDDHGVAWIEGTNTKVKEVVLDKLAYGWSPEEIHRQHSYISLAKIHAALAYYYDHQAKMDAELDRDYREICELRGSSPASPFVRRLRAAEKLS